MTIPAQTTPPKPDFRAPDFLLDHMRRIVDFYYPACLNREDGGFYNEYRDDGRITERSHQHIVSTTRFVVNFSLASTLFGRPDLAEAAAHGVKHLDEMHRDREFGGYYWILDRDRPADAAKQCYGHAFVLLAYASAAKAGLPGMKARMEEVWDLLETRFWLPDDQLYAEEFHRDWTPLSDYRGQNCNMHMTEAMIAAYEATGEARYLDRAETLAHRICIDLAAQAGDLVWEHYRPGWTVDWEYNKDNPRHLFRPYGYQPGHMTEWAKLLMILERYRPRDWMLPRARRLYDTALAKAADVENGGLFYGFGADFAITDTDKYFWVMAETLAAAACMAVRTGETRYWQDYDALWGYSWKHLVDHRYGAWYRILTADGQRYDDLKSPPAKVDYHPFGACYEVLRTIGHVPG